MALKLNGSTDGSVSLDAPADTSPSGTDVTLTLPTSAGSSGQYLQTNGSGTLSWQTVTEGLVYTAATPVSAGTSQYKEFTGIGSDVKRITILVNGASCSGNNYFVMQLGDSGGFETSGYAGAGFYNYDVGKDYAGLSSYFFSPISSAGHLVHGRIIIERFNDTSFIYTSTANLALSDSDIILGWTGTKQLSAALTQVRIGWNGNAFDAGTFRIITEV